MTEPPAAGVPFSPMLALLIVARDWETQFATDLRPLGLTLRKYALLGHVKASPGISFSELARRSHVSVQAVHVSVRALSEKGFVHDDTAHAGAASVLRISEKGLDVLTVAHRRRAEIDDRLTETMPLLTDGLAHALQLLASGQASAERG